MVGDEVNQQISCLYPSARAVTRARVTCSVVMKRLLKACHGLATSLQRLGMAASAAFGSPMQRLQHRKQLGPLQQLGMQTST